VGALESKTVVISGALGGMGVAGCRRFCAEGATVIGVDIAGDASALEQELKDAGHTFEYRQVDVGSGEQVAALAEHVGSTYGHLDILYNNAGILEAKPLLDTSEEDWDRVLTVNLKSVFLMTRAFVPLLKGRNGAIVNVSSIGGVTVFDNCSAYGASKAGVLHLTRVLAVEFAPDIRVNAICPGVTDTQMARRFASFAPDADAAWAGMESTTILGRAGTPDEVVNAALWLASDEASFVTGATINVDGGWSLP
jgi:3-oxoacyl-[acyl-carrier protein] reductase/cyclopentanol dehydrogenase/dihydroanticapsin dehydrogenase